MRRYSYHTLGGCPFGSDDMWNITWPATDASTTARQKCPGGSEAQGTYNMYYCFCKCVNKNIRLLVVYETLQCKYA